MRVYSLILSEGGHLPLPQLCRHSFTIFSSIRFIWTLDRENSLLQAPVGTRATPSYKEAIDRICRLSLVARMMDPVINEETETTKRSLRRKRHEMEVEQQRCWDLRRNLAHISAEVELLTQEVRAVQRHLGKAWREHGLCRGICLHLARHFQDDAP